MVAFLRGIDVGGGRARGDELEEILAGLGTTAAATYRARGNPMFDAEESSGTRRATRVTPG